MDRTDYYDRSTLLPRHFSRCDLGTVKHAPQRHRPNFLYVLYFKIEQRLARVCRGVVNQDVDPAELVEDLMKHLVNLSPVTDVGAYELCPALEAAYQCEEFPWPARFRQISQKMTSAPDRASSAAVAWPMPLAPPVTTATLPCRLMNPGGSGCTGPPFGLDLSREIW